MAQCVECRRDGKIQARGLCPRCYLRHYYRISKGKETWGQLMATGVATDRISHPGMIDMTGETYGRLTVLEMVRRTDGRGHGEWCCRCRCACGSEAVVASINLRAGLTKSCTCARDEQVSLLNKSHGMSDTPTYRTWASMKLRCLNKRFPSYARYGARGISICERWLGERGFENFFADMGPRPSPGHSIDRIDNSGNYEPGNCRWATPAQQIRNSRKARQITYRGRTMCIKDWAREFGVSYSAILQRLGKLRWSIEKALTYPVKSRSSA
jgi:hypothetical protein